MATVIRKRLQLYVGRHTIDRSINFVPPGVPDAERRNLRGVVFEVSDRLTALRLFAELRSTAADACRRGEVGAFLDALDRRTARVEYGPTFTAFAREWERTCVDGGGLRESTRRSDKSILDSRLIPYFGPMGLAEIGTRDIDRFKAEMTRKDYAAKTINNFLAVLHRIFEKAIEYGRIERNPVTRKSWMKRDATPEDARPWWTPEEESRAIAKLREWAKSTPLVALAILTQLITGIRFSELRALRKEDLDVRAPGLWIRRSQARREINTPKSRRARFQPLPREVADQLHAAMLRTEGQLLFPGPKGGVLSHISLNRAYKRLAREAGVRPITSHGARHTCASSYAYAGASQKMIAAALGHSDTGSTERYTHVAAGATAALVEARWERVGGRAE